MPNTNPPVRKQKRGTRTRRQLLDVTKALLDEQDYHVITLDQVAAEVGVSKSSILWHFNSKEGLLNEAVFEVFDELDAWVLDEHPRLESVDARIRYVLEMVARYFTMHPQAKGIVISLLFNSQTPASVRQRIVQQWREHNEKLVEFLSGDDGDVDDTDAAAIMALIHGCYLQWSTDGRPDDLRERMVEMYERFPIAARVTRRRKA